MDPYRWPSLGEPYDAALREAVAFVFGRYGPVGLVAAGTIVAGNPGPSSDLDLQVLHALPVRQRVQRRFRGVPAEIFVNPPEQIERRFGEERRSGVPIHAHMFATGFAVYDPDGVVARLRGRAEEVLAAGPDPHPASLLWARYMAANWLEDALDVAGGDPETCAALLHRGVEEAVLYRFRSARRWQPRHKELLRALAELDPPLAGLARRFYRSAGLEERIGLAREIVRGAVGEAGFFEWESEPQRLDP